MSEVSAKRLGNRTYLGMNDRGAQVRIGMGPGEFSPGDLLKLALATCNSLSADMTIAASLGEDFPAQVKVDADYDEENDAFTAFRVVLEVGGAEKIDQAARERLVFRAGKAIDKHCTIAHTLTVATPCDKTVVTKE